MGPQGFLHIFIEGFMQSSQREYDLNGTAQQWDNVSVFQFTKPKEEWYGERNC